MVLRARNLTRRSEVRTVMKLVVIAILSFAPVLANAAKPTHPPLPSFEYQAGG